MKFATFCALWPLLGLMWVAVTIADSFFDVAYFLDDVTDRMLGYIDGEEA